MMTDREAIEMLEYCKLCGDCIPCGTHDEAIDTAISALKEREERAMNWISVKERLPETAGDAFIVVVKEGNDLEVDIAEFNPEIGYIDEWVTAYDWGDAGECRITHWMPLPELPKEEA